MPGSERSKVPVSAVTWDRAIQLLIAAGMFYLGISGWFGEGLSAALRIGSLLPVLSALLGWSPRHGFRGVQTGGLSPRDRL